jgi:hypothetical protein
LSGIAMDDVRVHRNSAEPAKLGALAYAKGSDIHLGPGQERHLPHEAWHVAQQKQGRVRATAQMKGVPLNEDAALEREADTMGARALDQGLAQTGAGAGTAGPSPASPTAVVMRRIDPDFNTARGQNAGAVTKNEMQTFYDRAIAPELTCYRARAIDDNVKQAMNDADLVFTMFMLNSTTISEIHEKLNLLIIAVNAAGNNLSLALHRLGNVQGEDARRRERKRREDSIHRVGVTKEMPVRGFDSAREAQQLLTRLRDALNANLGANYPLGSIGIRGSAVTGIRSRTNTAFEQGTANNQNVSDASDIDFFFTCPTLEAQIRATENILPENRRLNQGGTMNAQYLHRWLTTNGNGYGNAGALDTALTAFSAAAEKKTGRKCDVTFIGTPTANGLAQDAGTLIF